MADEAKRLGFYLAGHTSDVVSVSEAAEAGRRSIEHVRVISFDYAPGCRRDRQHAVEAYSYSYPRQGAVDAGGGLVCQGPEGAPGLPGLLLPWYQADRRCPPCWREKLSGYRC